ncbi:septal ring lytic transglycosylase RlpA family protein [Pararhizobium sp. YC-54]|uniref:septal ring lytic transglycosylase RlpA family protein n=1 Tax=Pararhizobium sp. YC-54 TaxID=2986920 RepID=UPI0021F70481|nr:septal ring lytic transglycosylase RlpA family protein [Pararhizobium sp. YC-54]MCV9999113.1 septal ring lytic transglycosylase RlpA family protein [Pararhizobium sp. YC-54]
MVKMKLASAALVAAFALGATLTSVTPSQAAPSQVKASKGGNCGGASWYALSSRTASGERMNAKYLTAAHRNLKFGTKVAVTNKRNGKTVVVRINDRGPFIRGRVLDLSKAAASHIGMISSGTASICYRVVS